MFKQFSMTALIIPTLRMFLLIMMGMSILTFYQTVRPAKISTPLHPDDFGWEYQEITLTTSDELNLSSWLIPGIQPDSGTVILLLHGYPADKNNLLGHAEWFRENYDVMLVDFRYFGESEGRISTLGEREVRDVQAAVNYLAEAGYEKIVIYGFSMGGTTALNTIINYPDLPISAVISNSAFNDIYTMALTQFRIFGPLALVMSRLTLAWAQIFGLSPYSLNIAQNIPNDTPPILLLHNRGDQVVSTNHHQIIWSSLAETNPKNQSLLLEGMHGAVDSSDYQTYLDRVSSFIEQVVSD